ncbi:MAG TPA: hypothetical protein PK954_05450 [Anaerolineales bacterium]|nr:hypothetical protein [Anaerolineales bacterium]
MLIADRLHVPPWELDQAPMYWRERAWVALRAENEAAAMKWTKRNA